MKKVVRKNVWETNSSSMHTVTVQGKWTPRVCLDTPPDRILKVHLGEYGWAGNPRYHFGGKLSYAMSMVLHTEYPGFNQYDEKFMVDQDTLEELPGYKAILAAINKYAKCDAIEIKRRDSRFPYGYIDHQSYEDYKSLQHFLDDWNVDIERFLFDDNVVVYIDNDN